MKWGIIGAGKIAGRFARDLKLVEEAKLIGVASRNLESSKKFAQEHGVRSFASIEDLLQSEVEIIYVATPHPFHKEHSLAAIESGKSVLCEKPFAMNEAEAREVLTKAKAKKVFVMEAMWTRFFPAIEDVIESLKDGSIGELLSIESHFGYSAPFDPASRIFNPELGGGSLLDVGVYGLALVRMILQETPLLIEASEVKSVTGVDESASWTLKFPSGVLAKGESSVVKTLKNEARLVGSKGDIRIPLFWHPSEFYLNEEQRSFPYEGMGFQFEAIEVMKCLKLGLLESPMMSHKQTLDVMGMMDAVRERFSE